jgi:GT2 family glycosyltransferase
LVLIENAHNLGYGGGNNVGMRYALARGDASCFWLLNNDTVVKEHALTALMARLEERPAAGMCGSTIRYYQHRDRIQALGGARYFSLLGVAWHIGRGERGESTADPEQIESKLSYIVGASLLVSRRFVEDIGLLAEDYFLYFEEIDWAWRAKGRYTLAFAPDSVVYHKVGASIGTRTAPWRKSRICDYFTLRNRIVFTRRYCPWALPTIYAVLLGEFLLRVAVGRWDLAKQVAILFLQIPNGSADGLIKS